MRLAVVATSSMVACTIGMVLCGIHDYTKEVFKVLLQPNLAIYTTWDTSQLLDGDEGDSFPSDC
jgi:hypothetical protein